MTQSSRVNSGTSSESTLPIAPAAGSHANSAAAILSGSPDCVKVMSADGVVRFVNDNGLVLVEADAPQTMVGMYYPDIWPVEMRPTVIAAIRAAAAGSATCVEGFCPTFKGSPRWWETHFKSVQSHADADVEVIGVTRDVSERRARELALHVNEERCALDLQRMADELSDADRRTTEFIATLAHELRNPLAPIRTGLQLLRKGGDDAAAVTGVREMMERQVGQMVHLISDLLDIARVTSGKIELKRRRVELRAIINAALEGSAAGIATGRHSLSVDLPREPVYLDGDEIRLIQVFTNLLDNAAKYTPAGGSLSIQVSRVDECVCIDVGDSGIGIAAEALVPIFDMFTKVGRDLEGAPGGLGIGLNLVRRLVELHGGRVVARSTGIGAGSHFLVTLPVTSTVAATVEPTGQAPHPTGEASRIRVLLVDDNVDAVASLAQLLELDDHIARVAHSGAAALQIVGEFKPDIVFLDIGMPGMNGYEVAKALRQMPEAGNPVLVALTGWGAEADRSRSKSAGFDEHLTKPADILVIEHLLAKLIRAAP